MSKFYQTQLCIRELNFPLGTHLDSCQDLERRFVLLRYVFAPDVAVYFDAEVDLDSMSLSSHLKKEEKQNETGF